MLLTIKAALSYMWLPPTGSQESFRYGQLADLGCHGWAGYPDPGFQDQVLGDPSTALFLFSFQAVFKSGIQVDLEARDFEGELVVVRAGVSGRQGGLVRVGAQVQLPHCSVSQALPPSTRPPWLSTLLCPYLASVRGC